MSWFQPKWCSWSCGRQSIFSNSGTCRLNPLLDSTKRFFVLGQLLFQRRFWNSRLRFTRAIANLNPIPLLLKAAPLGNACASKHCVKSFLAEITVIFFHMGRLARTRGSRRVVIAIFKNQTSHLFPVFRPIKGCCSLSIRNNLFPGILLKQNGYPIGQKKETCEILSSQRMLQDLGCLIPT